VHAGVGELRGHAHQLVGVMGYNDNPLPWWLVIPWLALGVALIVAAVALGRWRERLALIALSSFVVLSPMIMAVVNGREHGLIWQGRYTLPLAVGALLLSASVLGRRVPQHATAVAGLGVAVAAFVAAGQFVAHLQSMTRYVLGLPHGLLDYLGGGPWQPPVSPWILVVSAAIITVAYAALLAVMAMPADRIGDEQTATEADDVKERGRLAAPR